MNENLDVKNLHHLYKKDMQVKVNDSHPYFQNYVTNLVRGKVVEVTAYGIFVEVIFCLRHPRYELIVPAYEKQIIEFNPLHLTVGDISSIVLTADKVNLTPGKYIEIWQNLPVEERDFYIKNKIKSLSFLEGEPILLPLVKLDYKKKVYLPLI